ncbi:MAG: hypothetical protein ACT4PE_03280 [Candidatus Eiseniibacteriota bacterium]
MRVTWFAAATLGLFLALRLAFLVSDPPSGLVCHYQDLASSVFDEGWWLAAARDRVLFGEAHESGFDLSWVSPAFSAFLTAVFSFTGVGLAAARGAVVAVGGIGVVLLLSLGGWRCRASRLAALWWSVSFAAAGLGRMALPESAGTTLALGAAWLVVRGGGTRLLAAGVLSATAVLVKPTFVFLLPSMAAGAVALAARRHASVPGALLRVGAGAAVPLAVWLAYVALHAEDARRIYHFYDMGRWLAHTPADVGAVTALAKPILHNLAAGVIYRHPLFVHLPVVMIVGVMAAPTLWTALLRPARRPDVSDAAVVAGAWLLGASLELALVPYQPTRYFLPVLPALAFVAAWAVTSHGTAPNTGAPSGLGRVLRWGAAALVTAQLAFAVLSPTLGRVLSERGAAGDLDPLDPIPTLRITDLLLDLVQARSLEPLASLRVQEAYFAAMVISALAALAAGAVVASILGASVHRAVRSAAGWRALPLVALFWQVALWAVWLPERDDSILRMSRDLPDRVDPSAVISPGGTFALENHLRFDSSALLRGRMYDAEGGATHFIALRSHPLVGRVAEEALRRRFPGSTRLATYPLSGGFVYELYRFGPPPP